MKLHSIICRMVSAVTASAIIITGFAVMPQTNDVIDTYAADTVVIDTTKEYQTIRGFGGINHPEWTGQDMTEAQRKTAFGNDAATSVLRFFEFL